MILDFKKEKAEVLWIDYCHRENKQYLDCAVCAISFAYVMIIQACDSCLDIDACLIRLFELFSKYGLGLHESELPWFYKKRLSVNFFREKKIKMEISYFLVYQRPNCSGRKFFKIPISVFHNDRKCTLSIEERCKFCLVCEKCKLVTFLGFDNIITKEGLNYIKELTSKK